jgi:hypothetical protein
VILPAPRNLTNGKDIGLIDPCFFNVTSKIIFEKEASPENFNGYFEDFVNKNLFYKGSDCNMNSNFHQRSMIDILLIKLGK